MENKTSPFLLFDLKTVMKYCYTTFYRKHEYSLQLDHKYCNAYFIISILIIALFLSVKGTKVDSFRDAAEVFRKECVEVGKNFFFIQRNFAHWNCDNHKYKLSEN